MICPILLHIFIPKFELAFVFMAPFLTVISLAIAQSVHKLLVMNASRQEIITSYSELIQILSNQYRVYVVAGILYGKNISTGQVFILAERKPNEFKFKSAKSIKGYTIISYICGRFNQSHELANKSEIDNNFESFFLKTLTRLGYSKNYGSM